MAEWRPNDDGNSESEEEEEFGFDIKGHEAIIFVVDAFLLEENDHFQFAIKLIRDSLLSGLIVNNKDLIGIIFANTKESPPPKEIEALNNIVVPKNCSLFLPLRQLNKDIVEYYLNFMEENCFDFENTYGVSQGNFANMIRLCSNMFQQCGKKLSTQTIVYFTDRELPHGSETDEFRKAMQKASDLEGLAVDFTLIPMRDEFDFEPFYKEFLSLVKDLDMDNFAPPDSRLAREMIADRKLKLDANKRCLGHVNWNLGNDLEISTKYYNYFQKSVYPKKVHLKREDNSLITAKIENFVLEKDPNTGEVVNKRELRSEDTIYRLSCGNQDIEVSESDMLNLQYPFNPILKLIGFKDMSSLERENFIRPCLFLYPDESRINGTTKLFTALWQRCLVKEKVAVCVFITRKKSKPSYVALVPVSCPDDRDESSAHTFMNGDGFKIVFLPLEKDYRYFDLKEWNVDVTPSDDGELLFKKIAKKLKVKYNPSTIKDPALDELQCKLLDLAFNIKTEGGGKMQIPSGERQDERIESLLNDFNTIFGAEEVASATKRANSSCEQKSSQTKKRKTYGSDLSSSEIDALIASNNLEQLNKDQLFSYLKANNLKGNMSMSKAMLIEKILEFRRDALK